MKKLLLALCMLPLLAACATIGTVIADASTVYQQVKNYYTDAPKAVYAINGGFVIVQTAVATFKATECANIHDHSFCASLIPELRRRNTQTEAVIKSAKDFVLANPNLDASALYNAAVSATEAFAAFATANGVQPAGSN